MACNESSDCRTATDLLKFVRSIIAVSKLSTLRLHFAHLRFAKPSSSFNVKGWSLPIGAVVTAATGVKKRSWGQGLFLVSVKRSRTIFKLGNAVKMQFRMVISA